ncbi:MAG: class I SAM-dependent methyltransferase [Flavobacteriales bacterium]|nr:class I SAM-dependent methyltransferase [Flavobacteriales bacterium]
MKENFFASIAKDYARFRPRYPDALFAYLASIAPSKRVVWDCATGSGQAAASLVDHFDQVVATDISEELLGQADPHERIHYRKADALASGLDDASIDLVTVANAMHWFHGEAFEREVRRVLNPNGVIAAWSFAFAYIGPDVDRLIAACMMRSLIRSGSGRTALWNGDTGTCISLSNLSMRRPSR